MCDARVLSLARHSKIFLENKCKALGTGIQGDYVLFSAFCFSTNEVSGLPVYKFWIT